MKKNHDGKRPKSIHLGKTKHKEIVSGLQKLNLANKSAINSNVDKEIVYLMPGNHPCVKQYPLSIRHGVSKTPPASYSGELFKELKSLQ